MRTTSELRYSVGERALGRLIVGHLGHTPVTERTVVMAILRHLGMPTSSPPISPARMAAQRELFDDGWNVAPSRTPQRAPSRNQIRGPSGEVLLELDPTSEADNWDA